jgi:menaquinol-cytochrome c reductase iron-sulfur subunit
MRGCFSRLRSMFARSPGNEETGPTGLGATERVHDSPEGADQSTKETRREFLARFGVGLAGLAAVLAGIPLVGAFFSTPARRERFWQAVGAVDNFPIDETIRVEFIDPEAPPWAGPAARSAAWLRRIGEEHFTAFSIYCTHTGCPVSWRAGANLFICPCHGGVFDREGDVVAGPPEEPLVRLDVRVRDQQVEVLYAPVPVTGDLS